MPADWYDEIHDDTMRIGFRIRGVLFEKQSRYQRVTVVETEMLGNALLIDGIWMTAAGDEKSYHELITHPALCTTPSIERVLLIGGGDGGTAREVLRHRDVKRLDMVEIDEVVVEASRLHLPTIGTAWDDPRLNLIIGDGIAHVRNAELEPYDAIIVDGSDPVGPAKGLFNEAFYRSCFARLKPHGVFVTQAESPTVIADVHFEMIRALRGIFPVVQPYYGTTIIYPGGVWGYAYAAKSPDADPLALDAARVAAIEAQTQIYNRDVHRAAFALPNYVKRALS